MMNANTTRLLVVLFLGMLALAYFVNQAQPTRPVPTPMPEVFPGVDATEITRIEVENTESKQQYTLVRVPGEWTGTDENGNSVEVDLGQVTRMIQAISTMRYNRVMEGSDVAAFGFKNGGVFVVRFDAGSSSYTLRIGETNSARTHSFVQRGDDPTVLQVPAEQVIELIRMVLRPAGSTATP
jgi:hypothetical protein